MTHAFSKVLQRPAKDARPPLPKEGIPKQRLPSAFRLAINLFVVPVLIIEQLARSVVQVILRPQARRVGQCEQTGQCCRFIIARTSPFENQIPFFRQLTIWWAQEVNGFFLREIEVQFEEGDDVRVYSCRHLTAAGTCASYWSRPGVCRGWPRQEWFGAPAVFKGCGYRFITADGADATKTRRPLPVIDDA